MKIEPIYFKGRRFWILRDDLIRGEFNGNKARKLAYFLNLNPINRFISHGSSQSNAMYSISVLAKMRGVKFLYFTHHICDFLLKNPCGNYAAALKNGMEIHLSDNPSQSAKNECKYSQDIFIPEGVAMSEAELGFKEQAKIIMDFAKKNGIKFDIFLPSGTGCSAAFLAKNLDDMAVWTTPCVGDSDYLKREILSLDPFSKVNILNPPKKYHFGKIYAEIYAIYKELLDSCGVEFELLYDGVGWLTLMANLDIFKGEILYIHQGGMLGNITLLDRYRRKFDM
ncbi:1-aminocyclopropane-1-carboxylate deaminase [Campylobacter lanienae NCTC 13004]|uniref:1-aminocyclopropane-1-carboxylate deaminase n=1 Tax=Campylobacter lanienae NCTC 13004 TaxID=1031753 RepID=A0A1X9SNG5_9BACT|nr:1-aminocyclopropane-1-carboxylate deaminase [Campylobacter lanienae]ARQ97745.1 1-aminocyclopropane-1-carboxylate deaminase [Campylobacter lanienae NCTC 13004]